MTEITYQLAGLLFRFTQPRTGWQASTGVVHTTFAGSHLYGRYQVSHLDGRACLASPVSCMGAAAAICVGVRAHLRLDPFTGQLRTKSSSDVVERPLFHPYK